MQAKLSRRSLFIEQVKLWWLSRCESQHQDVRMQGMRTSEHQDLRMWTSEHQDIRMQGYAKLRASRCKDAEDVTLRAPRCKDAGEGSFPSSCCLYICAYGVICESVVVLLGGHTIRTFIVLFCLVVITVFMINLRCIFHQQTYCPLVLSRVVPQYIFCFIVYTLKMWKES